MKEVKGKFSFPQTMLTAISMSAIATNGVVPGMVFLISKISLRTFLIFVCVLHSKYFFDIQKH